MLLSTCKKLKFLTFFTIFALLAPLQNLRAADKPGAPIFNNPLALVFMLLMVLLLIVIGVLAGILLGTADISLKKRKKAAEDHRKNVLLAVLFLLLPGAFVFAQDAGSGLSELRKSFGGLDATTFYSMVAVIFLELTVIIVMLINIRFLIKERKEKLSVAIQPVAPAQKSNRLNWWDKINKFRPITQEAELDLGHEYDGIRELNNKLPPWWLYGFYLTIIVAFIYLWRFHISHNGPSSKQEYEQSVARAEIKIKEYLKTKGETVDENTVELLTSKEDIAAGKEIFLKSCATCHTETGGGDIGPNLTDDFWLHGNDIKSIFTTIRYGINAMPQWQNSYSNKEIAQVASYVKSLHGTNPPNPKTPQGVEIKEEIAPVSSGDSSEIKKLDKYSLKEGRNQNEGS